MSDIIVDLTDRLFMSAEEELMQTLGWGSIVNLWRVYEAIEELEEQSFYREQFMEYLKDEYDDDFIGNQDGRDRREWAHDKAFDDMINMAEVKESLETMK